MRKTISNLLECSMVGVSRFGAITAPISRVLFPESLEIDTNESLWARTSSAYVPTPPLGEEIEVDVAVIGGGFTGVSTCYYLAKKQAGIRIALLEARALANGASGRTAGLMLNWFVDQHAYGDTFLKPSYELTGMGMSEIRRIINEHNLEVSHRSDGTLQVFTSPERAERGQLDAAKLNGLGIPVRFLDAEAMQKVLQLQGAFGAMFDPQGGQLNGLQYVRALRAVLMESGVSVFEETPVVKLDLGSSIRLSTPRGVVIAKTVVLATNAYTGKLGLLQDAFFPLHSFAFATDALSEAQKKEIGWFASAGYSDDYDRISYSALSPEGHMVFGGGSNATYQYRFGNKTAAAIDSNYARRGFEAAERTWRTYAPGAVRIPIKYRWCGILDLTLRRNLIVNRLKSHPNLLYAIGFCGHGVVLSNIAGQALADMITGNEAKWRAYPFFESSYSPIAPEPFRWLGYQLFTALTGRSPRI